MKKIIIIRNAFSFDFGGGERMPVNLAKELIQYDFEPLIVSKNPRLLDYAKNENIKSLKGLWWSHQDWSGNKILFTPIYFMWLILLFFWYLALFTKERPTVVHIQSRDDFISATLAARLIGACVIWSDHADLKYIYQNYSVPYKNLIGKVVYLCSGFAKTVIMTSQSDINLTEEASGLKLNIKYRVIYNGVVDQPKLLLQKPEKTLTFVCTSRLVAAKGIFELIEAFKVVNKGHINSKLWIVGEGPEEKAFKKQAEDCHDIIFYGFSSEPLTYVAKSQIFVHPSYLEGFSISIVEACMLGKPIIACNVGGNPEIIDSTNGILIPKKNIPKLTEAMNYLASNIQICDELGKNSRKKFLNSYEFSKVVKESYIPLYEK